MYIQLNFIVKEIYDIKNYEDIKGLNIILINNDLENKEDL